MCEFTCSVSHARWPVREIYAMRFQKAILILGIFTIVLTINFQSQKARAQWYAGTWDSNIYNRAEKPRTVAMRFEIRDSDTDIPVRDAQVTLEGQYLEEWVGRPVDRVGPLEPQEKEFRITAKTNEEGLTVFALSWQKEYPWRTYFGDHEPREYTGDSGSYRIRDSWIRAVDDIEKVQRIEIRHTKYRYKEMQFNFRHLLEFGQDKGSELQRPELFDKFEQAWIKEIKRKNVKFCVLNLGTKFKDFQNKKCKRSEFFEKEPEDLLKDLDSVPENIRMAVRNNGGGHVNHSLFWEVMGPEAGGQPHGELMEAINKDFGSFDKFKEEFKGFGIGGR